MWSATKTHVCKRVQVWASGGRGGVAAGDRRRGRARGRLAQLHPNTLTPS